VERARSQRQRYRDVAVHRHASELAVRALTGASPTSRRSRHRRWFADLVVAKRPSGVTLSIQKQADASEVTVSDEVLKALPRSSVNFRISNSGRARQSTFTEEQVEASSIR